MKSNKILLGIFATAVFMAVAVLCAVPARADTVGVDDYDDLVAAVSGAPSDGPRTIQITGDFSFPGGSSSYITVDSGQDITIVSSGGPFTLMQAATATRHFIVEGDLTLENITLNATAGGGVQVQSTGSLTMNTGAVIQNCHSNTFGGGVYNSGTFTMNTGAVIVNNTAVSYAGGVYSSGTFTMNAGAEISGNSATSAGGVYNSSTFDMIGGEINDNTAGQGGGVTNTGTFIMAYGEISGNSTVSASGGGVLNSGSAATFTMDGGKITGNQTVSDGSGGGVYSSGTFTMNAGAEISGNSGTRIGGGVYNAGTFTMNTGAELSGNSAATYAGGVHNTDTFNMNGGKITGNTSSAHGGGVCNYSGTCTFTMNAGSEISGNSASTGGGVYNMSIFNMNTGAVISGNTAEYGGGVMGGATFNMTGGKITGNTASIHGGGVWHGGPGNTFDMIDSEISGNLAIDGSGGGVYVANASLSVSGASSIINNKAPNGAGGGIHTTDYDYSDPADTSSYANISTAATTVFSSNVALAPYVPPSNANSFTNIGYATTSIITQIGYVHPLNNYDINYEGPTRLYLYSVTYDANGGTGGYSVTDITPGSKHTAFTLAGTGISRTGHTFTGWNSLPDGIGATYAAGDTLTVNGNVTLYAQWKINISRDNHSAYIIGYPDGTMRPENNLSRAEAASIFFRLLTKGTRESMWSKMNSFTDVKADDWYNNAISTLTNGSILNGYPNGSFAPDISITRAEFASVAVKFNIETAVNGNSGAFSDISGHWAESDIKLALQLGYITGYEDGTFRPDNPIGRAEAAMFLNNVLNRHVEAEEDMPDGMATWPDNMATDKWYYFAVQEATNSHTYERKNDGVNEIWIELLDVPDWAALERPDSEPGNINY